MNKEKETERTEIMTPDPSYIVKSSVPLEICNSDITKFLDIKSFKDFPFLLKREVLMYVNDLYKNHLDWIISSVFQYTVYFDNIFPSEDVKMNDSNSYIKLLQSFYLNKIKVPKPWKKSPDYREICFIFYSRNEFSNGNKYKLKVNIRCKKENSYGVYYLWRVNFVKVGDDD